MKSEDNYINGKKESILTGWFRKRR